MKNIFKVEKVNIVSSNLDSLQVKIRISIFNKIVFSYFLGAETSFKNHLKTL
ncbi:hypothetical protein [Tenacibaculum finnmarkense]|uniref:Uncharacterized protein n=1 Tax=Tenacibaculum finnmarkense genomovar ulcerans TaxID=2781388 RepID=A0A2I2M8S4_9FLAO|nr:hypothetical protein [Tenacibaculum finnmarkense]MBE7696880.1 hypothetical protein [Tenacibaculum finnmarkense genomovar ulcerans]MCG8743024.1 hypothetical protein [Tenacibaculum finnmarkense]MCG8841728.1 hypothetical protein [Tenacibaculum finnmarkense]MCG8867998.1 hypothetical protein [Tenacibaculum finnmarkense]MCG8876379.1 hypothetical protein [Tenacibaculum finnmarkense]